MKKFLIALHLLSASVACASDAAFDDAPQTQSPSRSFFQRAKDQVINAIAHQYFITSTVGYDSKNAGLEKYMYNLYKQDPNIEECKLFSQALNVSHLSPEDEKDIQRKMQAFNISSGDLNEYSFQLKFLKKEFDDTLVILTPSILEVFGTTSVLYHFISQPLFTEGHQIFTRYILKDLIRNNPNKRFQIISHYIIEDKFAPRPVSLMDKINEFVFGIRGHYIFTILSIDPVHKQINVQSVNSKLSFQFGEKENHQYFEELSSTLEFKLNSFEYLARGDQTLNMNDCGRFATIYMDEALKGRDLKTLTSLDIYRGFKKLEANGYEQYHQKDVDEKGEEVILASPSLFAKAMGIRRALVEYVLSFLISTPFSANPLN